MSSAKYIPGVCNIGPAEIRRRRQSGYVGLGATAVFAAILMGLQAPAVWRLLIFLPVSAAATGFLQAQQHFCARFGMVGLFNFRSSVGRTDTVLQAEFRAKDRRTALRIVGYSSLIGVAAALTAYFWL